MGRAAWRVQPGKPPERLSPHYRLDCEFGSALIDSWKHEGYEPIYVCEEHAKQFSTIAEAPAPAPRKPAPQPAPRPAKSRDQAKQAERKAPALIEQPAAAKPAPAAAPKPSSAIPQPAKSQLATAQSPAAPAPTPKPAAAASILPKPLNSPKTPDERRGSINRLIGELTTELENLLAQSEATISAVDTIDSPLDQALQRVIADATISDAQKDAAMQQLGALQQFLKLSTSVEIGALKAYRLQQMVYGYLRSDINIVAPAKPGYRAVCDRLQAAIHAAAPKSKHLEERLDNMFAMKSELENPQ